MWFINVTVSDGTFVITPPSRKIKKKGDVTWIISGLTLGNIPSITLGASISSTGPSSSFKPSGKWEVEYKNLDAPLSTTHFYSVSATPSSTVAAPTPAEGNLVIDTIGDPTTTPEHCERDKNEYHDRRLRIAK